MEEVNDIECLLGCKLDPGHAGDCKRGRGRPKGARDLHKRTRTESLGGGGPRDVPPSKPDEDFAHADPMTMLDRQLSMISWQQQALRNKMKEGYKAGGKTTDPFDTKEILDLSNALVRAIEAMKKHADLAEELAKRLTGEQLLEAAIKKIEGQSLPTINYAIKRLRAYRESVAPVPGLDRVAIGRDERAVDAIAALVGE